MSEFAAGQMLKCVAIPERHEGYYTVGNNYQIGEVDPDDYGYELNIECDSGFTLWCEASAFVAV